MRHNIMPFIIVALVILPMAAQPKWQRESPPTVTDLELFHATMTANFPTTETLKKGDFMYEISHRFIPPIKDGYDAYWGIDGPARIRTALGFGITNRVMVTLGRSNLQDNLDLRVKVKLLQMRGKTLPGVFSARFGTAVNTETVVIPGTGKRGKFDSNNWQFYGQLIYNTMLLNKKFGIGIVPSYLYNSNIFTVEKQYTFTLGNYYQYYFNNMWSLWLELNPIIAGYQGFVAPEELNSKSYNHIAFGLDIETGGHFFHLFITNNVRLNPSQMLVGADRSSASKNWRLAFGITRYL